MSKIKAKVETAKEEVLTPVADTIIEKKSRNAKRRYKKKLQSKQEVASETSNNAIATELDLNIPAETVIKTGFIKGLYNKFIAWLNK